MSYFNGKHKGYGVVTADGKNVYTSAFGKTLYCLTWLSKEDFEVYLSNRDPLETPTCQYRIQPENQGKLIWLSGPPGA